MPLTVCGLSLTSTNLTLWKLQNRSVSRRLHAWTLRWERAWVETRRKRVDELMVVSPSRVKNSIENEITTTKIDMQSFLLLDILAWRWWSCRMWRVSGSKWWGMIQCHAEECVGYYRGSIWPGTQAKSGVTMTRILLEWNPRIPSTHHSAWSWWAVKRGNRHD